MMITTTTLASALVQEFPHVRSFVENLARTTGPDSSWAEISPHLLLADAFLDRCFRSAVDGGDSLAIERCFGFVDVLLESQDDFVVDAAHIELVEAMTAPPFSKYVGLAGPALLESIRGIPLLTEPDTSGFTAMDRCFSIYLIGEDLFAVESIRSDFPGVGRMAPIFRAKMRDVNSIRCAIQSLLESSSTPLGNAGTDLLLGIAGVPDIFQLELKHLAVSLRAGADSGHVQLSSADRSAQATFDSGLDIEEIALTAQRMIMERFDQLMS